MEIFTSSENLFKFLLKYLETGEGVELLTTTEAATEIQAEARFYGLQKLLDEIENRLQVLSVGIIELSGKISRSRRLKLPWIHVRRTKGS